MKSPLEDDSDRQTRTRRTNMTYSYEQRRTAVVVALIIVIPLLPYVAAGPGEYIRVDELLGLCAFGEFL